MKIESTHDGRVSAALDTLHSAPYELHDLLGRDRLAVWLDKIMTAVAGNGSRAYVALDVMRQVELMMIDAAERPRSLIGCRQEQEA